MIRVLVNGAAGRMGQEVVRAVNADTYLSLVAECDMQHNLVEEVVRTKADVVVDFTTAHVGLRNAELIIESGARPVIGTSGFKEADVKRLQQMALTRKLGGVIAPNFAIGAVLMMKFAAQAAKYLPDVEIIELHHDKKADSPSGTAIRTAELIAEQKQKVIRDIHEVALLPGARGAAFEDIHIHSVRLPGLVAHQQVLFGGQGQTLLLQHDSLNRESFMPGVVLACKEVMKHDTLFYGLEHLLN